MNKLILWGVAIAALSVPALAQMARHEAGPQTRADAEAKVREQFGKMDANGDRFVTRDEIMASVDTRMAERGTKMADQRGAAFDALDTDKNGSLSREEFAARGPGRERIVMRMRDGDKSGDGAKPGDRGPRMMMRRFGGPDGDMTVMGADGRISIDAMVTARLARFDKADANKDGTLTPEERKAAREARREMRIEAREPMDDGPAS